MKRWLSFLLALCMILALAGCGSSVDPTAQLNEIQAALKDIQSTVDNLTAGAGAAAEAPAQAKEPIAEGTVDESNFVRQTAPGTLTVGTNNEIDSFDPVSSTFGIGMFLVYDTLFTINKDGEIVGVLAEDWEYQDDTHLYVKLYDDAAFSNGDPVTSEDVLWSLERLIINNSRWSTFVTFIDFENSEIINDKEFVLTLNEAFGPGLAYLTVRTCSILDKAYVESIDEDALWDQPIGSGPYVCTSNIAGSMATFERRDDYWNAKNLPEAEEITVRYYSESTTMFIDYENGVLDMAFRLSLADTERLVAGEVADTNYKIQSGLDVYGLALPEYVPAFDDIRVREAFSKAVDWAAVNEVGLGVLGGEATSILPEGVMYRVETGTYTYDPDAAKALLDEAGFDYSQTFDFVVVNSDTNVRLAEAIQAYLQMVGINVDVIPLDWTAAVTRFMQNDTDLVINSMGCTSLDPDQQFDTVGEWSTNGSVRVTDPDMAGYLTTGRYSVDPEVRAEAYANAQQWMYDNIRQVAFAEPYYSYCYRPYISTDFWCATAENPNLRYVSFTD